MGTMGTESAPRLVACVCKDGSSHKVASNGGLAGWRQGPQIASEYIKLCMHSSLSIPFLFLEDTVRIKLVV